MVISGRTLEPEGLDEWQGQYTLSFKLKLTDLELWDTGLETILAFLAEEEEIS